MTDARGALTGPSGDPTTAIPAGHSRFFSLEGVDGSGKTTQMALLSEALRRRGFETLCIREPGGTRVGDRIREILLAPGQSVAPEAELLLFSAARAQLVAEVIRPALEAGKVVLADRFGWSTWAYQGHGRGQDPERIRYLFRLACDGIWPAHSWLLDLPADRMRDRLREAGRGPDRMENEKQEFFERVRRGYLEIASAHPGHFTVMDAGASPESIHALILDSLLERLGASQGAP
jgi:dTMP kinase